MTLSKELFEEFPENKGKTAGMVINLWIALMATTVFCYTLAVAIGKMAENAFTEGFGRRLLAVLIFALVVDGVAVFYARRLSESAVALSGQERRISCGKYLPGHFFLMAAALTLFLVAAPIAPGLSALLFLGFSLLLMALTAFLKNSGKLSLVVNLLAGCGMAVGILVPLLSLRAGKLFLWQCLFLIMISLAFFMILRPMGNLYQMAAKESAGK